MRKPFSAAPCNAGLAATDTSVPSTEPHYACAILVAYDLHEPQKAECEAENIKMDERKRESIVAYLRRRMAEFGIKPEDVASSIASDQARSKAARYRDAAGHTWDGNGVTPQWVVQATSAGQSLEHFAISENSEPGKRATVDRRNDPFAGTRLAMSKTDRLGAT